MTNALPIFTIAFLATLLFVSAISISPQAFSSGSNGGHDDDDDDEDDDHEWDWKKEDWKKHKPDCECKKPDTFTVTLNGPDNAQYPVVVDIYKKISDIDDDDKKPIVSDIEVNNGEDIVYHAKGKKKISSDSVYRILWTDGNGEKQESVIKIHTSCSQDLFIGDKHSDNQMELSIKSGSYKEKQSIFEKNDLLCEGATLTIKKIVIPENEEKTFNVSITGATINPIIGEIRHGEQLGPELLPVGTYEVSEVPDAAYTITYGGDCDEEGFVSLEKGKQKKCIITNTEIIPATITVKKAITNDNGGTAVAGSWSIKLIGVPSDQEEFLTFDGEQSFEGTIPAGTYKLIETLDDLVDSSYTSVLVTGDSACPSMVGEEFLLEEGQHVACTIYNDDNFVEGQPGPMRKAGVIFYFDTLAVNITEQQGICSVVGPKPCIEQNGAIITIIPNIDTQDQDQQQITKSTLLLLTVLDNTIPTNDPDCRVTGIDFQGTFGPGFLMRCPEIFSSENNDLSINFALVETDRTLNPSG